MSDAFALLVLSRRPTETDLSEIVARFEGAGMALEFPGTSEVRALNRLGETVVTTRRALFSRIMSGDATDFQWWLTDAEDICCQMFISGERFRMDCGLQGLDDVQTRTFAEVNTDLFATYARRGTALGLVVDRAGQTAEFDWQGFFEGRTRLAVPLPDVVGANMSCGRLLPADTQTHSVHRYGDVFVLTRFDPDRSGKPTRVSG